MPITPSQARVQLTTKQLAAVEKLVKLCDKELAAQINEYNQHARIEMPGDHRKRPLEEKVVQELSRRYQRHWRVSYSYNVQGKHWLSFFDKSNDPAQPYPG